MPPVIEHCCSNSAAELLADEDIVGRLVARRCLEHCGICRREPFVVVGGKLLRVPCLETDADWELAGPSR